jgi:hypothetical protein
MLIIYKYKPKTNMTERYNQPTSPVEEEQNRQSRIGAISSRVAGMLSRRGHIADTSSFIEGGLTEEPTVTDSNPDYDNYVAQSEQEQDKPEIVKKISALMSDESIQAEHDSLAAMLVREPEPDLDAPLTPEYRSIADRLYSTHLKPYPKIRLDRNDERTQSIEGLFATGPKLEAGSWIYGIRPDDGDLRSVYINSAQEPLQIPASNVVHAKGIDSWEGRENNRFSRTPDSSDREVKRSKHDGVMRTSAETIDYYAGMDTPIPPVDSMAAYVQPNGLVLYVVGDGSHRAAAMLKQGSETIPTKELTVMMADRNYIDLPQRVDSNPAEQAA